MTPQTTFLWQGRALLVAAASCGLLWLAGWAAPAHAAGYWTLERGASTYARGGANIAAPVDPIGLYLNPAALAGLDGLQLHVDANWAIDNRRFQRVIDKPGRSIMEYELAENSWKAELPSPGLFASYSLGAVGVEKLTVAAGVYGPVLSDRIWPEDGAQRYSEIESHSRQIHYALAAAYELPWYGIRVGATGMLIDQIFDMRLKLYAEHEMLYVAADPEDPAYDADVHIEVEDLKIPSAIFGISGRPIERLTLAIAYQLPYNVDAHGKADISLTEAYQVKAGALGPLEVRGTDIDATVKLPGVLRAAARYDHPENLFDVELAFVWEAWSRNDVVVFTPKGIAVFGAVGEIAKIDPVEFENHMHDTYSVRLGGSYQLLPELLRLRAGGFYESAAVDPKWVNASSFDMDKMGGTLGCRVDLPHGIWIDLAGGYSHWQRLEVSNAETKLEAVLYPETEDGRLRHPVANGTYENSQIFIMGGLGAALDL